MTALSLIVLLYVATACLYTLSLPSKYGIRRKSKHNHIMLILPVNVTVDVCLHNISLEHCHQHKAYIDQSNRYLDKKTKQSKTKQNKHSCNKKPESRNHPNIPM